MPVALVALNKWIGIVGLALLPLGASAQAAHNPPATPPSATSAPRRDTVDISVLRVVADSFPEITVYFRAERVGGGLPPAISPQELRILENGNACSLDGLRPVAAETPVHLALVMDRSASMMDEFIYRFDTIGGQLFLSPGALRKPGEPYAFDQAKEAVLALALEMDMPRDGLIFVSFSDRVDPVAPMRRDTTALARTLRDLRATGSTAFYDGILTGLDSLATYSGLRAVVAMTDGTDNASYAHAEAVVRRAREIQAPVYVVGLGNVARDTLLRIAAATRGACYYVEEGSLLPSVYRDIVHRVRNVYVATYTSPNFPAPAGHRIEVRLPTPTYYLREHAGYFQVPPAVADAWETRRSTRRITIAGTLLLLGLGLMGLLYFRRPKHTPPAPALTLLPETLVPPRIFPNPTAGPLTVAVDLVGRAPTADLLVTDLKGNLVKQYVLSGHRAWLSIELGDLPGGVYHCRISDGEAISPPVRLVLRHVE